MNQAYHLCRRMALTSTTSKKAIGSAEDIQLWHKRLGHVSTGVLNKMLSVNTSRIAETLKKCIVCPCAKQARLAFPSSSISIGSAFELHMDIWGPYKVATFDGNKYF